MSVVSVRLWGLLLVHAARTVCHGVSVLHLSAAAARGRGSLRGLLSARHLTTTDRNTRTDRHRHGLSIYNSSLETESLIQFVT